MPWESMLKITVWAALLSTHIFKVTLALPIKISP